MSCFYWAFEPLANFNHTSSAMALSCVAVLFTSLPCTAHTVTLFAQSTILQDSENVIIPSSQKSSLLTSKRSATQHNPRVSSSMEYMQPCGDTRHPENSSGGSCMGLKVIMKLIQKRLSDSLILISLASLLRITILKV